MPIADVDATYEHRHILFDPAAGPLVRESLSWLLPLPQLGLGLIFYTWVHAQGIDGQGRAGAAAVAYGVELPDPIFEVVDGLHVPDALAFNAWVAGPMAVGLADGMGQSRLRFDGEHVAVDCTFDPLNPAFAYGPNPGGCPQWLASDRVEQGGRYRGTIRVGDRTEAIDSLGHRDHSWGMRDWGAPTHWKWWNVLAGPDMALHVMQIQAFGNTSLHGYVHKDGVTASVLGLDADCTLNERLMHTQIDAVLRDDAGVRPRYARRAGRSSNARSARDSRFTRPPCTPSSMATPASRRWR